jgi:hypothetical protein
MVPIVAGENVTLMVQVAPGARLAVQVVVSANSPLATMLLIVNVVVVLVFFIVTVLAALVVPTPCEEKLRIPGVYDTVCAELLEARANRNTRKEPTIARLRVMDISRLLHTFPTLRGTVDVLWLPAEEELLLPDKTPQHAKPGGGSRVADRTRRKLSHDESGVKMQKIAYSVYVTRFLIFSFAAGSL